MVTPKARVFGVDWRIYARQSLEQKVLGVDWRIYPSQLLERKYFVWTGRSLLRCCSSLSVSKTLIAVAVRRSASEGQQRSGQSGVPGRSAHDESLFRMAESFPEGTGGKRGVSVENVSIPNVELESASAPFPVGPISDGTSWTILQRSKHYSVSRMFLREKLESVRFMIIVTDPSDVSTHAIIKVSREVTEVTPLVYSALALFEMVLLKLFRLTL